MRSMTDSPVTYKDRGRLNIPIWLCCSSSSAPIYQVGFPHQTADGWSQIERKTALHWLMHSLWPMWPAQCLSKIAVCIPHAVDATTVAGISVYSRHCVEGGKEPLRRSQFNILAVPITSIEDFRLRTSAVYISFDLLGDHVPLLSYAWEWRPRLDGRHSQCRTQVQGPLHTASSPCGKC
jgi:hypothetical protein